MKIKLLMPAIFILASCATNTIEDPKLILKKAREKCSEIQNGYYETTVYLKFMTDKDTVKNTFSCNFRKLTKDTLFGKKFHFKAFLWGQSVEELYTGNELVSMHIADSTAEISSCNRWAAEINSYKHNYEFYAPLANKEGLTLMQDSDFNKPSNIYKFLGKEKVNNMDAYHIQIKEGPKKDIDFDIKTLSVEYNYWIRSDDFIPVQYTSIYVSLMDNDTMIQYEKAILNKYEINNLKDIGVLSLKSIPSYYKKKDYVPYVEPELLPQDTVAPNWELLSTTDKKVSLKDLKGQVVLIDFFYKGCYPCMQALPDLQALSEKYKDKGFKMIGIDPNDTKEDGIVEFLAKRGVTYTVLLGGAATAKQYRVSGYPSMYIIDKKGKIIYSTVGYGPGAENEFEEIIKKSL